MKKLLIVVDYQNDFVDGSLGFKKALDIKVNLINKIMKYHENKDDVIFTMDTHDEDYLNTVEGKYLPVKHCIKNTYGHELYPEIKTLVMDSDKIFEKNTFPSIDLANYLRDKEYESIELCGVVSNICVLSNAIMVKASLPNTRIFIDRKAIASNDDDLENKAIDILRNLHIEVI